MIRKNHGEKLIYLSAYLWVSFSNYQTKCQIVFKVIGKKNRFYNLSRGPFSIAIILPTIEKVKNLSDEVQIQVLIMIITRARFCKSGSTLNKKANFRKNAVGKSTALTSCALLET